MAFIMASHCERSGHGTSLFPMADLIVAIGKKSGKGKPEIRFSLRLVAMEKCFMKQGDKVDVGFDPSSNSIRIATCGDTQPSCCTLHPVGGGRHSRVGASVTVRAEWRMPVETAIPSMPCTNIMCGRGEITARLPDSWSRFWRK